MKRSQDITLPRGDRRDVLVTVRDEATDDPKNLIGFNASWIVQKTAGEPPIVAITSEDDDRLEVGGSDGQVMLRLDRELTDLPVRSASHRLILRDESGGAWTVTSGTLTLTR